MEDAAALAAYAGLLADRSRAAICLALVDGRAWTAGELAAHVGIAKATASEHLSTLVAGGLLSQVHQGRHRYVRLAGPRVAELVEDLQALQGSPAARAAPTGLRQVRAAERLRAARTCYDHLAGDLGVAVHAALTDRGLLADGGVTDRGRDWFAEVIGPECLRRKGSRPLVRDCVDWTRRVPHLGGALGAAFCAYAFEQGWVVRPRDDREVAVTAVGGRRMRAILGI